MRIRQWLEEQGVHVCIPAIDERFAQKITPFVEGEPSRMGLHIASDWSERHAAYAAGLGTFGLTRALITEKGIAGRFGSLPPRRNLIRLPPCRNRAPALKRQSEHQDI